jgi:DNA repair protein RecO (recombination protein O)
MLLKDEAICIRTVDYSETSQIVTFFTREHGKLGVIAKGAKRAKSAFEGPLETFVRGHIVFRDSATGKLGTLMEFQPIHDIVSAVSMHLYAYHCCLFSAELVAKLTHDADPHVQLYDAFLQFLQDTCHTQGAVHRKQAILALLVLFEQVLLREIGLMPRFAACANCGQVQGGSGQQMFFSSLANGFVCRDCEMSFPERTVISPEAALCLVEPRRLASAASKHLVEIETLFIRHFTHLLHGRLRTAQYVLTKST